MQKIKFILYLSLLCLTLSACGSLKETGKILRNEKVSNSDEFLIQKRNPLSIPPDFRKLPLPESASTKNEVKTSFEKMLGSSNKVKTNKNPSSLEESILTEIRN